MEEFKYKTIVDYSYDWEIWENRDGKIEYVSPSCKKISGYSSDEFIAYPNLFESLILEEDLEIWKSHCQETYDEEKMCIKQFRILHKDGYIVWIEHVCKSVLDEKGIYLGRRTNNRDITAYKNSIETIVKNEKQFEKIIETLPFSLSIIDFTGTVLYINQKGLDYYQIKEDIIGKSSDMMCWISEEEKNLWMEQIKKYGKVSDFEMHLKTISGKELWAIGSGIIIDYQGKTCVLSSQYDITERKEIEKALKESEEQYKLLFENATESIVVIQDRKVVLSNAMATTLTEYPPEELGRIHFVNYIYPDDADLVVSNHIKRLNDEEVDRVYSYRILTKSGRVRWVEMNSLKIEWEGRPATFNLLSDITERKKSEDALKESEEKHRLLFENAVEAILVIQDEYIKICNPMTAELTGYSQEELSQIKFTQFVHEEDKAKALDFHKKRLQGLTVGSKQQFRIIRKDGSTKWIESDGIKIDWEGREATLQFVVDITERKTTEEKILYLSYFDQLTGLYNRRFYEEELKKLDTERNLPLTLVMADVNGLKLTNDAFGHSYGDMLLKSVAQVMKKELRKDDIIARIGGDEFIIILPKTDSLEAKLIVTRIREEISKLTIDKIAPSVSFGLETKNLESEDIEKVFSKAEDYMYKRKLLESSSMKSKMMTLITRTLYERDKKEQLHSQRVADLCRKTAEAMDFELQQIEEITLLGMFHDIGKIGLNQTSMKDRNDLSEKEKDEIKKHSETGYHILKSVSEFAHIAEYVLSHHERPDGKGYPRGLKEDDIPIKSRILSIAEAYDSMTNNHYKNPISRSDAIKELLAKSGTQFDRDIVKIFIEKVI